MDGCTEVNPFACLKYSMCPLCQCACIQEFQVMLTEFEYVPLIKVVGIKFPLYDETPREDFMPTFMLRK